MELGVGSRERLTSELEISDMDFAPALHNLGQLGYTLLLITPSISLQSSALYRICTLVGTWSYLSKGDFCIDNVYRKLIISKQLPEYNLSNVLEECKADPLCNS